MSTTIISSNMGLPIPVVGQDLGPDYALNVDACLVTIDSHNHAPGMGVPVTPSGLNITSDLTFQGNNATNLRTSRYSSQSAVLSGGSDIGATYVVGNELYYNDLLGNQVQITQNGNVAGSSGSIAGLTSPASATYVSLSTTFVWQSAANTSALMDAGSIILRNATANSFGLTLNPPLAMGANYSLTLPTLPGTTNIMSLDTSGAMAAAINVDNSTLQLSTNTLAVKNLGVGTAQLAANAVTTAKILDANVTLAKLATAVVNLLVPTASVIAYGSQVTPDGWLMCDGASYLRTDYAALFNIISDRFGAADGTHFNVPDLRGRFVRGWDDGATRDPNSATRTAMNANGATGDNIGSVQVDTFKAHTHTFSLENSAGPSTISKVTTATGVATATSSTGDAETRPINAYLNYLIKI